MREIKFRGFYHKEKDALYPEVKKWVYGSLIIKGVDCWINDIDDFSKTYKVDPKSVGQYTGFKDKNDKEIYEGNICQTGNCKAPLVVIYNDCGFEFGASGDRIMLFHDIEIIGNIYENPELLKGE